MNKFTLPTLEERIEYKKQEDEKLKKRIEESVEKLLVKALFKSTLVAFESIFIFIISENNFSLFIHTSF